MLQIEEVTLHTYRLPYRRPVAWSDTEETEAAYLLLRVVARDGSVAYAEATAKPTWSGYTPQLLAATLRELFVPLLALRGGVDPAQLSRQMARIPGHAQARGLVETALWQLQRQGDFGAPRDLPVSCTLTRRPPQEMARDAAQLHELHGVRCFKLKGGQGRATDLAAVAAVRSAVPQAQLSVDANSAYAPVDLPGYAAALADLGVGLLEDPCPFTPAGFAALARGTPLPLLVDLAAADASLAAHYVAQGAAAVSAKPGRYGLPEALAAVQAARERGGRACIGLFGESDLGSAVNLAAAALLPDEATIAPTELSFFLALQHGVLAAPPRIRDGVLRWEGPPLRDADLDFDRLQPLPLH